MTQTGITLAKLMAWVICGRGRQLVSLRTAQNATSFLSHHILQPVSISRQRIHCADLSRFPSSAKFRSTEISRGMASMPGKEKFRIVVTRNIPDVALKVCLGLLRTALKIKMM